MTAISMSDVASIDSDRYSDSQQTDVDRLKCDLDSNYFLYTLRSGSGVCTGAVRGGGGACHGHQNVGLSSRCTHFSHATKCRVAPDVVQ